MKRNSIFAALFIFALAIFVFAGQEEKTAPFAQNPVVITDVTPANLAEKWRELNADRYDVSIKNLVWVSDGVFMIVLTDEDKVGERLPGPP